MTAHWPPYQDCHARVKWVFVLVYVAANVWAYAMSTVDGTIQGDFAGFPAPNVAQGLVLLCAIVASYLIALFPVFRGMSALAWPRRISTEPIHARPALHFGVLALQIFLLVYSLSTDSGSAGRIVKSESPLRFIVYFIPVDYIALVYLAIARSRGLYKANLLLYILSNILRGWSSVFLFLFFIFLVRARMASRMTPMRWLALGLAAAVALPVAFGLRFYFRAYDGSVGDLADVVALMQGQGDDGGWSDIVLFLIGALVDRFQHFSSVAMEFMAREQIRTLVFDGLIRPFVFDGAYFTAVYAALGIDAPFEMNSMLIATFIGLDPAVDGYNTHTGLVGWPIVMPELAPLYLVYLLALGVTSIVLAKRLRTRHALEITWLMWLILLMNGWFGGFVSFVVALLMVHLLQMRLVSRSAIEPTSCAASSALPAGLSNPA